MDVDIESGAESSLSPSETHGDADDTPKVDPLKWTVRCLYFCRNMVYLKINDIWGMYLFIGKDFVCCCKTNMTEHTGDDGFGYNYNIALRILLAFCKSA